MDTDTTATTLADHVRPNERQCVDMKVLGEGLIGVESFAVNVIGQNEHDLGRLPYECPKAAKSLHFPLQHVHLCLRPLSRIPAVTARTVFITQTSFHRHTPQALFEWRGHGNYCEALQGMV